MPRFNRMVVNGAISDRNIFRHSVFVQVKCLQATNTKKYLLLKPHRLPYEDVIEKVKIVTIPEIREKDFSLAINNYIEKKEQETVPPAEIRRQYFEAYKEMIAAEEKMRKLLLEGGYISE